MEKENTELNNYYYYYRFRVKTNDPEILKKYGFKLQQEWISSGALDGTNVSECHMMDDFLYIYQMDERNPSKIEVDEYKYPMFMGWIRLSDKELWFDTIPYADYCHREAPAKNIMINTIYQLTKDGLLERVGHKKVKGKFEECIS